MDPQGHNLLQVIPAYLHGWLVALAAFLGAFLYVFRVGHRMGVLEERLEAVHADVRYVRERLDGHLDGGRK